MPINFNTTVFGRSLYTAPDANADAVLASGSGFQKYLQAQTEQAVTKPKEAPPTDSAAAIFDPFAAVRSGALPESNRFVQALEHMYGIAAGSLTGCTIPAEATSVDPPSAVQPEPITTSTEEAVTPAEQATAAPESLSAVISNAMEQSVSAAQSASLLEAVIQKMR